MVSSVGSLSGLSAADIQSLFGAIGADTSSSSSASSSSSSTTTGAAQSASTPVAAASPNDPINAIKSILAQAQVGGGSGANSGLNVTGLAAYAAQTSGDETTASVIAASGAGSTADSAAQKAQDMIAGIQGAEFMARQYTLGVQEQQTASSTSATNAPPAATSNETTQQPVLQLTVRMVGINQLGQGSSAFEAQVAAQAQQLATAFENNTFQSNDAAATTNEGFIYKASSGPMAGVIITGVKTYDTNAGRLDNYTTKDQQAADQSSLQPFQGLINQSNEYTTNYINGDSSNQQLIFRIPLGNLPGTPTSSQ